MPREVVPSVRVERSFCGAGRGEMKRILPTFRGLPTVHLRASRYGGQPSWACQPSTFALRATVDKPSGACQPSTFALRATVDNPSGACQPSTFALRATVDNLHGLANRSSRLRQRKRAKVGGPDR